MAMNVLSFAAGILCLFPLMDATQLATLQRLDQAHHAHPFAATPTCTRMERTSFSRRPAASSP
jgi:hypothetical protein